MTETLRERIHYRVFGVWPQSVVERRLAELREDERRRPRLDDFPDPREYWAALLSYLPQGGRNE